MLERNPYSSSYPVDIDEVQSLLPQSSEGVPAANDHIFTGHELNEENNTFPDALATPLNSPFGSPSENVDPRPLNTLSSVAPLSIAISPPDPSKTLRIPSSSEMLSDSLGVLPTQHTSSTNIDDVYSDLPNDLTDHVTRSNSHPFTSGSFGDIYRGDLDVAGRLINVSHHSFLSGRLN